MVSAMWLAGRLDEADNFAKICARRDGGLGEHRVESVASRCIAECRAIGYRRRAA